MPAHLTSPFAILGLLLAAAGLVMCTTYAYRPHRLIPLAAAAAILLSLILAHFHSTRHVSRLQVDRPPIESEEDAFSYAKLLEARGEDVAAVRFAEDTQSDVIDRAGLDEADLAYFDSIAEAQPVKPVEETTTEESATAIILVDEATFTLATRLNRWNLNLTKILLALAALLIGYDYLRRFNDPQKPSFPLPLPSALPNAVTPLPAFVITGPQQNELTRELTRLAQRGDAFLCLTDDPEAAAAAIKSLASAPKWRRPKTLIHIHEETTDITDDFIFESLWYGRSSFIVDHPERRSALIDSTLSALTLRTTTRARVRQSFHIIWNLTAPPTESQQQQFTHLAQATGTSLIIL